MNGPRIRQVPVTEPNYLISSERMADVLGLFGAPYQPALTKWERVLVYFGLMRDPGRPYTHSFTPVWHSDLWDDWEWTE